jgi:hypothetical protein
MTLGSGRRWRRVGGLVLGLATFAPVLLAQDSTARRPDTASTGAGAEQDYLSKRQSTLGDIRATERKLAELRTERIQLESRVESVAAKASEQRANELLLSHETTALRSLDSVLTASQDNLLAQRDRFLSLGEAVRRRAAAELVIVVRVDSSAQPQQFESASVQVDSTPAVVRRYSAGAVDALNSGAIDELYRANVLPATHVVSLAVTLNGTPSTKVTTVDVPTGAVTYVQFTVRNGQLVLSTWSSRSGTSP